MVSHLVLNNEPLNAASQPWYPIRGPAARPKANPGAVLGRPTATSHAPPFRAARFRTQIIANQRYPGVRTRMHVLDLADRKSTRLNSSHLGISYAVFCLKKKTTGYAACAWQGVAPWGAVEAGHPCVT